MPSKKPASKKKTATKRTPKKGVRGPAPDLSWHPRFLDILSSTCNVTLAARGAGVNKVTAYEHYKTQPDFARAWDEAKDSAVEILEAEAWNRARKTSDTLLIFLLKAHKPKMYRERYEVAQTSLNINWDDLTEDELAAIAGGADPAAVLSKRSR